MNATKERKQVDNQQMALDRHMAHTERARAAAETIMTFIEDHGEVAPDDVDWGHVGTMGHIATELEELVLTIRS